MLKDISVDFDHNKLIIYVRKYGIGQYVTKYNEQINTFSRFWSWKINNIHTKNCAGQYVINYIDWLNLILEFEHVH